VASATVPPPGRLPAAPSAAPDEEARSTDEPVAAGVPEPDVGPDPGVVPREVVPEAAVARETSSSTPAPAPREPAVAAGDWVVQVGAFGSADSARKLAQELTSAGFRAFVSPVARSGKTLHRVRVGPEADRSAAEQLARRLAARKLPASVVRND
jgi:DedD protein